MITKLFTSEPEGDKNFNVYKYGYALKGWQAFGGLKIKNLIQDKIMFVKMDPVNKMPYEFKMNFPSTIKFEDREEEVFVQFSQTKTIFK